MGHQLVFGRERAWSSVVGVEERVTCESGMGMHAGGVYHWN